MKKISPLIMKSIRHFFFQTCQYFLNELMYKVTMATERELTYELDNMDCLSTSLIDLIDC